jgi:4-hydroxy-3-methylbut-2-en-1-yl diphosphate reductase
VDDARAFRRSLNKSGRYVRQPKNDQASQELMEEHGVGYSTTGLVAQMRTSGFTHVEGDVSVIMADSYGFCWGVERAVRMAYEARKAYPGKQIWITNEIIHNPTVNRVSCGESLLSCVLQVVDLQCGFQGCVRLRRAAAFH